MRFDPQLLEQPSIEGIQYQQGALADYETQEYLLEKWGQQCAYCGIEDVPLQVEHMHPRARGGTSRISNLTLACQACNQAKGTTPLEVFLAKKPQVRNASFLPRPQGCHLYTSHEGWRRVAR
ncbi:hypothetical protein KSC_040230 [Ktedonobacter sp. SOSP1-52]|nr:hypothetical protein KSC_040230 [Ktedonobacter sp. SOSP1-52]